jgi:NAD(P)-dependent dehydrogenase (short-subunit alcohol dehydrogenase family)
MELQGKVALVTGAGSGIGAASALLLARAGAQVGALGHTKDELQTTVSRIQESGGEAMPLLADVASPEEMSRAVDDLIKGYGRLDIVVANAGINGVWAPIDELAPEEWDRTIAVNLRGTFLTLRSAVPRLKLLGGGSVVIIASINGTRTFTGAGATAYACSKAAQLALGQMAAVELGKHGIRVNVICPGAIETEIGDNTQQRNTEAAEVPAKYPAGEIPLTGKRPGRAEDVAELVLFLSSDRARHISGSPVWIDGAQSLLM